MNNQNEEIDNNDISVRKICGGSRKEEEGEAPNT